MKKTRIVIATLSLMIVLMIFSAGAFAQGSLTPPGAPAPTMKSLSEVFDAVATATTAANTAAANASAAETAAIAAQDPRIAVNSTNTPGDSSALYKITQPGSYYLTGNLIGENLKSGIQITTESVSLDLNGFSVIGVAGSLNGITADFGADRVTVVNGTVRDWGTEGVTLRSESLVERVFGSNNGFHGVHVASYSIIRKCEARNNAFGGIRGDDSTIISECVAAFNGSTGIVIDGTGGQVVNCESHFNDGGGISAGSGGSWLIKDNTCSRNKFSGIDVCYANTIVNNNCYSNGFGAEDGHGINVRCGGNRVEGNQCVDNDIGINANINSNEMVFRNTSYSNTTANYSGTTGNDFGPVGSAATATSPFANISH